MIPTSPGTRNVLKALRIPCARTCTLVYGFSREAQTNIGYTLEMPDGEPAVACGTGTVIAIRERFADWAYSSALSNVLIKEVLIEHGDGVRTLISGLASVSVVDGDSVERGAEIGYGATSQVHFRILLFEQAIDPAVLGAPFAMYDGRYVPGQDRKIRFAPDKVQRDPSEGYLVRLYNGIRYFKALISSNFLVSVDCNGSGTKVGPGQVTVNSSDYWNVYSPAQFYAVGTYACGYGTLFSSDPVLWLYGYDGERTSAWIEKIVEPLAPFYGSTSAWDTMLGTWLGGYSGINPVETFFNVRGLPMGTLDVYLYGFVASTTFMVSVNSGSIATQVLNPNGTAGYAEGRNYVKFTVSMPFRGILNVKAFGYFSGMQIIKV
jgi:murein DD-endopeptidase MepM/ murein hydrolase activator NlpD